MSDKKERISKIWREEKPSKPGSDIREQRQYINNSSDSDDDDDDIGVVTSRLRDKDDK